MTVEWWCTRFGRVLMAPLPERGTYKNWRWAILSLIGYSVGLGNFWRFPYLCFKHEGATFFIPYLVALFIIGIPLYFMDLALGQYASVGVTQLFSFMCPMFSGVGFGMILILMAIVIYYNVIIAWTIFYIGSAATFNDPPPWASCDHHYMHDNCTTDNQQGRLMTAKLYYLHTVLGRPVEDKPSVESNEMIMVVCLGIAWFLVAVCLAGGIRGTRRVLVFTVVYPYILLGSILAWSYDNKESVSNDFFKVNFTYLKSNFEVWNDAATQVIYSLGIAHGGILTLASHNKLHQNILRDTIIVCLLDTLTSVFCAYVVHGISGFLTKDFLKEKGSTSALVFIAFPAMISQMGAHGLWSLLFFFMIFALGFDSQLMMVETVTTAIFDEFKILRCHYIPVVCIACTSMFLLGIPMMLSNGKDIFDMLDNYTTTHSLILLGFLEVMIVSYVYGFKEIMEKIKGELNIWVPSFMYAYWAITWKFLTPVFLLALLSSSLYEEYNKVWKDESKFDTLFIMGVVISFSVFVIVPVRVLFAFIHKGCTEGFSWEAISRIWKATSDFCPEYIRIGRDSVNRDLPENVFRMEALPGNPQDDLPYVVNGVS